MDFTIQDFVPELKFFLEAVADSMTGYLYAMDIAADRLYVSHNTQVEFEFSETILESGYKTWMEHIHPSDRARVARSREQIFRQNKRTFDDEYQMHTLSGRYFWIRARGRIYSDDKTGKPLYLVGVLENLEQQGTVDRVTGLRFYEQCSQAAERLLAQKPRPRGGILLFDMDDFTRINTLHSHTFGDMVMRTTLQDMQAQLPELATLYRFNGDQFLILYPQATMEDMRKLFFRLQEYTRQPHKLDGVGYQFSISAGVAMLDSSIYDWSDWLRNAVVAMRLAKESGKNRVEIFRHEMLADKLREQHLVQEMASNILRGCHGFSLVYQPICAVDSLKLVGAEALLRYESAMYGNIRPSEFIPLLEKEGLMTEVGMWTLRAAVAACKQWTEKEPDFKINVNVSLHQSLGESFDRFVMDTLKSAGLDAHHLVLELTESYFIDEGRLSKWLNYLRKQGVQFAIDDFGTGYSSLGRLQQLPSDIVKIDRSFITDIHNDSYKYNFVKAVIALCHNAGLRVCAEGIEDEDELRAVNHLYADTCQGYYTAKPMNFDDFTREMIENPCRFQGCTLPNRTENHRDSLLSDNDLLRRVLNTAPICVNLWNEQREHIACNTAAVELFDLRDEGEYLERFFELSPKYQPDGKLSTIAAFEKMNEAIEKGKVVFPWMHCKLDGTPIPAEITLINMKYNRNNFIVCYTKDLRHEG